MNISLIWKNLFLSAAAMFAAVFFSGCATTPEEVPMPLDITMSELEKKMLTARDPDRVFARAESYVQKLIVTVGSKKYMMELKFATPDRFRINTLLDNKLITSLILNGNAGWLVDYQNQKITSISGRKLEQMQILYALSNPGNSYRRIFRQVALTLVKIKDQEYYLLTCYSRQPDQPPLKMYIGKDNFMLKRMHTAFMDGDKMSEYDSQVEKYTLSEGVMIPEIVKSTSGGIKQSTEVVYNKLNAVIPESEFYPPVFTDKKTY